jgi:hypothetical protein
MHVTGVIRRGPSDFSLREGAPPCQNGVMETVAPVAALAPLKIG